MPFFPEHVIIFHGYAENSRKVWFPWLTRKLEAKGVHVDAPDFPDPIRPDHEAWVRAAKTALRHASRKTLVIGHSLGGAVALRAIEQRGRGKIGGLLIVGTPFCSTIKVDLLIRFFEGEVDWRKLQHRIGERTILQAKDDPLVPYDHAYRYAEALRGKLVLAKKGGHFNMKRSDIIWRTVERMLKQGM